MYIATYDYNSRTKMKWADANLPSLVNYTGHKTTILKLARPSVFSPDEPKLVTDHIHTKLLFPLFKNFNWECIIFPVRDTETCLLLIPYCLNILTLNLVKKLNYDFRKDLSSSKTSIPSIIPPIHAQTVLENRMFSRKVLFGMVFSEKISSVL